jgi:hypothetical protein
VSDFDAYEDDVERSSSLSDHEIDRLVTGRPLSTDAALQEITAFFEDVRPYFWERPNDLTASRHLAAIAEATRALSDGTSVTVRGTSANRARSALRRRKLLVLAAAFGVLLAFGGAAFAGALPGPVQGAVSDLVRNVGVSVPGDGDSDDGDSEEGGQGGIDDGPVGDHDDRDLGDVAGGDQRVDKGPGDDVGDDQQRDGDDHSQGEADDAVGDKADDDRNDDDQGAHEEIDEGQQGGQQDGDEDDDDQREDDNGNGDGESGRDKDGTSNQPRSSGWRESAPHLAAEVPGCHLAGATARLSRAGRPGCR